MDIWYKFLADGSEFNVDPNEFHQTKWVNIGKAKELITDLSNLEAISKMEELFKK